MRTWVGDRIDDGTTAVFAYQRLPRPSLEDVGDMLHELRQLSENPGSDPQWVREVLARKEELIERIEASDGPVPIVVPIHPPSADRRFDWGDDSPAATALAHALLTDAVGDPPPDPVAARFAAEVIAFLPREGFRLDAADLHEWLLHAGLAVEAELAAHRGGLDPHRPALHVVAPDEAPTGEPTDGGGATDAATASALVAACEQAWADIQRHHPDVPHAVVVLGSGVEGGRLVKLGHWWGGRWLADGEVRGEVLLAGEALHLPAEQVFEVLLHEAAHGLNASKGIKDASRGGRYHNKRFRATAELVGLDVAAMPPYGWARTTLTPDTIEQYQESIDRLGDAMRIARTVDRTAALGSEEAETGVDGRGGTAGDGERSGEETGSRRSGAAACGCGRRMRMAPSVLAAGPVLCGVCGSEFEVGRQVSAQADKTAPAAEQNNVVDHTFLARRQAIITREHLPEARLAAFLSAAREVGIGAHPAVVALAHRHDLLSRQQDPAQAPEPAAPLTPVQREGLIELALAGDKPGDFAVVSWYQALGTEHEQPMPAGTLEEAGRRRNLARAMLKADGTLHGPAVEVIGREFLAGERIVVGPNGIPSLELDGGIPGTVEQVDPAGQWLDVDFPTAGHYRFPTNGPEAAALAYGYADVIPGLDRVDLRTLDLHPPIEAEPVPVEPVPTVPLPEIEL
ncbi:MAG: DUF6166 domain-containing protein [Actinomycetota bacterium]|jgi:hypothetical protein